MKSILLLTDSSSAARRAALLASSIAGKTGVRLLTVNLENTDKPVPAVDYALVAKNASGVFIAKPVDNSVEKQKAISHADHTFQQGDDVSPRSYTTTELYTLINKNNIGMVITGFPAEAVFSGINFQTLLNQIQCPLLLVPEDSNVKSLKRITYMADLRYCRTEILRSLVKIAKPHQASVLIAQLSLNGLPHLTDSYAATIFKESIYPLIGYEQLIYQNIKERNIAKAADVLVNGMHSDLLVLENRRFHFEEILGSHIQQFMPEQLSVPLLIFPC